MTSLKWVPALPRATMEAPTPPSKTQKRTSMKDVAHISYAEYEQLAGRPADMFSADARAKAAVTQDKEA